MRNAYGVFISPLMRFPRIALTPARGYFCCIPTGMDNSIFEIDNGYFENKITTIRIPRDEEISYLKLTMKITKKLHPDRDESSVAR